MAAPAPKGGITLAKRLAMYQGNRKDWEYSDLAKELHRWCGIFNAEWKLDLPATPHLFFAPIRNAYATYEWGRGALGTPDNITMNTATLDRPSAHTIRTLGHELLHLWQQYHGEKSPQRNYHNDQYVEKALECGIIIDHHGCTAGHNEVFSALIAKHGIRLAQVIEATPGSMLAPTAPIEPKVYGTRGAAGTGSKMKKWSCDCTNVRCAVELVAVCAKCAKPFLKAD